MMWSAKCQVEALRFDEGAHTARKSINFPATATIKREIYGYPVIQMPYTERDRPAIAATESAYIILSKEAAESFAVGYKIRRGHIQKSVERRENGPNGGPAADYPTAQEHTPFLLGDAVELKIELLC